VRHVRIKPSSLCTDQAWKPFPSITSILGACSQVIMSCSTSLCCQRMVGGSILVIAMVPECLALHSRSRMADPNLMGSNQSSWPEQQAPCCPQRAEVVTEIGMVPHRPMPREPIRVRAMQDARQHTLEPHQSYAYHTQCQTECKLHRVLGTVSFPQELASRVMSGVGASDAPSAMKGLGDGGLWSAWSDGKWERPSFPPRTQAPRLHFLN
jgi:hypothetical protein